MLGTGVSVVPQRDGVGTAAKKPSMRTPSASRVRWVLAFVAAGCLLVVSERSSAAAQPGAGFFDPQARDEASRAIPFDQMNEQVRGKLWEIVSRPSLFRRMPAQVIDCDPDLYVLLIRYPEVIVNMWQMMGITKVQVKRTGPFTFEASDGAGTVSSVELVYGRPDLHVFYADGAYEGPLLHHRTDGHCVLLLRSAFTKRDERMYVTSHLDVFVRLNDAGTEIVAKTLQPVVGKAVDNNFIESLKFLGQVSQATELNGPGMQLLVGRLTNVDPAIRQTFSQQVESVYQKAVLRGALRSSSRPAGSPPSETSEVRQTATTSHSESAGVLEPVPAPGPGYRR